ncbi:hypothetical protein NDJ85_18980 [Vibrio parahaemolyticus]|uniref:hypothetical protein n=1 Tax=Vibrio parahaemolyticus TaxID=670 RepID=UPI00215E3B51|nr:hypothetical protein [Vibrio parahaemolyticus]MCS0079862.1 hypothetical protein [Vibrio parahaemolyticus]HCH5095975.1 hypothetical protein [Vibrio parahaemolyticus]
MRYVSGFENQVITSEFESSELKKLPAAIDRFNESRYFAQQFANLDTKEENLPQANWFLSAYFAAVISIREAAELDMLNLGYSRQEFKNTSMAKETYMPSDGDEPSENDPLAINRMFKDIRNLRVHFALPLVSVVNNVFALNNVTSESLRKLRRAQVTEVEVAKFNSFIKTGDLNKLLFQHLYIQRQLIVDLSDSTKA